MNILFIIQAIGKNILYLGPGIGGGLLSVIIAFIISFLTFIVAIVWYPIKKIIHIFRKNQISEFKEDSISEG
jgi:hypothetical protein